MFQQHKFNIVEQTAFNLFRKPSTDRYKRFVICVVYDTIKSDSGITLNKLKAQLKRSVHFDDSDVDAAVAALSNDRLFDCLSKFEVPGRKFKTLDSSGIKSTSGAPKPVHLRAKAEPSEFWELWLSTLEKTNPDLPASCMLLVR